jgi:hypothetical protein
MRANTLYNKRFAEDSSALSQRFENLQQRDHFQSSLANVSQNILPATYANTQSYDGLRGIRQQENNNNNNDTTTNSHLHSSKKDDKILEENKKKEDVGNIAKVGAIMPSTAGMAGRFPES